MLLSLIDPYKDWFGAGVGDTCHPSFSVLDAPSLFLWAPDVIHAQPAFPLPLTARPHEGHRVPSGMGL